MKKLYIFAVLILFAGLALAQWTTNPPSTKTNITGAASAPAVLVQQGGTATNISHYGLLLPDVAAAPLSQLVTTASKTNWCLAVIDGIPTLVASNYVAGGWLQKALWP